MPVAIRGLGFLADLSVWSEGLNRNFKVLARALGFLSAVMVFWVADFAAVGRLVGRRPLGLSSRIFVAFGRLSGWQISARVHVCLGVGLGILIGFWARSGGFLRMGRQG